MFENTRCWVQVAVLLLLWLLLTIVASSLMFVVADFGVDIQSADNQLWLQFLSQIISFAGTALLFAWFFYGSAFDYFHLKASSKQWGRAGVAVFIMLLMLPVIDWITVWNDAWHFPASLAGIENMLRSITAQSEQLLEGLLMRADLPHLVLNIIVIALCPALCEELFFRGALQQVLHRWFGNPHWAIILTAVIFSLAHGEIFAFVPRFLLGVVLRVLYGSTSVPILSIMHLSWCCITSMPTVCWPCRPPSRWLLHGCPRCSSLRQRHCCFIPIL